MSDSVENGNLLVPIHIDALLVGTDSPSQNFQWSNLAPDFGQFAKDSPDYLFGSDLIAPFQERSQLLEPGLHLHFRLPNAFTHTNDQNLNFPRIPNRWLVQRYSGTEELDYQAWIIKSDAAATVKKEDWPEWKGVVWPEFFKDAPSKFSPIGTCTPLDSSFDGEPDAEAKVTITAVGPGNPAFSAFYPGCRSVLGFHDPAATLPEKETLTYLVTGWYSAASEDPLHEVKDREALRSWLRTRNWSCGYDLRLMKLSDPKTLPDSGRSLVIVALVGGQAPDPSTDKLPGAIHIRIFDPDGRKVVDKPEGELVSGLVLNDLKELLNEDPFPDGAALLPEKVQEILDKATSISDHTRVWVSLEKADNLPSRILCHGLVRGIKWQGKDPEIPYRQQKTGVRELEVFPQHTDDIETAYHVAVGNNSAEALAALLADGEVNQDLLSALQADRLAPGVTASEMRNELHDRRFRSVSGGTSWIIRPEVDRHDAKPGEPPSEMGNVNRIPTELRKLLRELNEQQRRSDARARKLEEWRWQLYAIWHLWTKAEKDWADTTTLSTNFSELQTLLKTKKDEWDDEIKAPLDCITKIKTELKKYLKTLSNGKVRLGHDNQPELKYRLVETGTKPFQQPMDPVVAVGGPAAKCLHSHPYQQTKALLCRVPGQLLTGMQVLVPAGPIVAVRGEALFEKLKHAPVPGGIHGALLREALLLDPNNAAAIAEGAPGDHKKTVADIIRAIQNPPSSDDSTKKEASPNVPIGSLPDSIAVFPWVRNPWIPIYLAWEISWQSDYGEGEISENLVTKRWTLKGNSDGDLSLQKSAKEPSGNTAERIYEGYSILTPRAFDALVNRLSDLDPKHPHPLVNVLKNRPMMTQMLGGFNASLTMQHAGLQLPPLDYKKWENSKGYHVSDKLSQELLKTVETSPVAGAPFFPIRSGRLRIKRLHIVDAFGQTVKLPDGVKNASAGNEQKMLRRAHNCIVAGTAAAGDAVTLRPRFVEPIRLSFRWENATAAPKKESGPVCGWVVPNHLEKNLTIYASDGKPLGALQRKLGVKAGSTSKNGTPAKCFYWVDVPDEKNAVLLPEHFDEVYQQRLLEGLPRVIKDGHLLHLCSYLLSLDGDEGGTFIRLLNDAKQSADQRVPEEDPGVSVLVGSPLALVRASLRFEIPGLPAHKADEFEGSFLLNDDEDEEELLKTHGFKNVTWPLRLGDLHTRNDGLIGLFKCASGKKEPIKTSGPFYPVWGLDEERLAGKGNYAIQNFTIDCVNRRQVTMLIDPQARVHATTGVLPKTYIELDPTAMAGAKRAREVFFQTAPVLGVSATPSMPKPSDDYGEWSWAYRTHVTTWKLDPNLEQATERAAFGEGYPAIAEGWLKLKIASLKVLSFWVRDGVDQVGPGSNATLAWSLQGAESLKLETINKDGKTAPVKKADGQNAEWSASPLPREFPVTIHATTTYRLTGLADNTESSFKELTIEVPDTEKTSTTKNTGDQST
jgi:hypothetical protein